MGPINYTIDVQQPFQAALQGFQAGSAMRQVEDQRALQERQQAAQQAMQMDLAAASKDQRLLPGLMVKYPQLSEQLKRGWDVMSTEQQRGNMEHASQVYAALSSGRPDVAQQVLRDRASALRNSGDEQGAKTAEDMARWSEMDPDSLKTSVGLRLAALPGGDKVIEGAVKLGAEGRAAAQAPSALRKSEADAIGAEADAKTKGVTAQFAESNAIKDLETKGWNIKALQADIDYKKQSSRIAAMNAAIAKEGNALKRQELQIKVDEAIRTRDDKIREKVATAESGAASIDNMLNTIERVKANKSLDAVLGSMQGKPYYPNAVLGTLNPLGDGDERSDAIALIETLGSQAFIAQIPNIKGTGALSDAEGKKLQSALQNLSREQSESQFRKNLDEAARLLKNSRQALSKGLGVPLGKPDTPAAPGSRPSLDSFDGKQP